MAGVVALGAVASFAAALPATAALPDVKLPPAGGQFDYQIGGPYDPDGTVKIVSRDRTAPPADVEYNICYINAMQTQPDEENNPNPELVGTTAWYLKYHNDLVLKGKDGKPVMDGEWGEAVLDIRTAAKQKALLEVQKPWIDGCKASKYDAIEPDNLESYSHSEGAFPFARNREYMVEFVKYARGLGLAVAQKNTVEEYGADGKNVVGFSFAIAEQCGTYEECPAYREVYGNLYYEIEYFEDPDDMEGVGFTRECEDHGTTTSIIRRDKMVTPRGHDDYKYVLCPNHP
nr:DNA for SgaA, complete cds [Kibdelosporangium sp. MJ126-NF4]CTQ88473.1 DNA for SgaA, complete cds [Kibdelosporangium sp. MJ126-NF4]